MSSNLEQFKVALPNPSGSSSAKRTPRNNINRRSANVTPRRATATPFDRKASTSSVKVKSERKRQTLITSVLGIVPLKKNTDLEEQAATQDSV